MFLCSCLFPLFRIISSRCVLFLFVCLVSLSLYFSLSIGLMNSLASALPQTKMHSTNLLFLSVCLVLGGAHSVVYNNQCFKLWIVCCLFVFISIIVFFPIFFLHSDDNQQFSCIFECLYVVVVVIRVARWNKVSLSWCMHIVEKQFLMNDDENSWSFCSCSLVSLVVLEVSNCVLLVDDERLIQCS